MDVDLRATSDFAGTFRSVAGELDLVAFVELARSRTLSIVQDGTFAEHQGIDQYRGSNDRAHCWC